MESKLDVASIQSGCLDEREVVLAWKRKERSARYLEYLENRRRTGKLLGLLGGHGAQMSEIGLVSN